MNVVSAIRNVFKSGSIGFSTIIADRKLRRHLSALMWIATISANPGCGSAQKLLLCGVSIPAKARRFVNDVEIGYKRPIQCKSIEGISEMGGAIVTANGPLILINPQKGANAVTITHELLHLYLSLNGFQINPRWYPPDSIPPQYSLRRAMRFESLIYDELQHRIIAPIMRSMGLNLNAVFAPHIRALINSSGAQVPPEQAIVNMLRLADNDDSVTLKMYEAWLRRSGYASEEELGEWSIRQERSDHFDNTEKALRFCRLVDMRLMKNTANYTRSEPYR